MKNLSKPLCPAVEKQTLTAIIKIILFYCDWNIIKQEKEKMKNITKHIILL